MALEAYWGPRPYVPYKKQKWSDKELEGMHDAIKAALDLIEPALSQQTPGA